jgi:hypothetical protein
MASSDGMRVNIGLEMTRSSLRYYNGIYVEILNKTTKNPSLAQGPGRDSIHSPTSLQVDALPLEPPCCVILFVNFTHVFWPTVGFVIYVCVAISICQSPALLSISLRSAVSSLLNDVRRVDEPRIDDRLLCRMQHLKELF